MQTITLDSSNNTTPISSHAMRSKLLCLHSRKPMQLPQLCCCRLCLIIHAWAWLASQVLRPLALLLLTLTAPALQVPASPLWAPGPLL
eukprot:1157809-Pelagomonas_calceolata.AAC.5